MLKEIPKPRDIHLGFNRLLVFYRMKKLPRSVRGDHDSSRPKPIQNVDISMLGMTPDQWLSVADRGTDAGYLIHHFVLTSNNGFQLFYRASYNE